MSSYARRRRKRRRREEEERQRRESLRKERLLKIDKKNLSQLLGQIDQMSDEGKIALCREHGKDLIDLTTALIKIPTDEKGRSYAGVFNEQGNRLYGHFFYGTKEARDRDYRASANESTSSIALIIHPDLTYSAYPGDHPEDEAMKVTKSADILSVQFALAAWAARVDSDFDEKLTKAIDVLKSGIESPSKCASPIKQHTPH
jgi:hypothetical protein